MAEMQQFDRERLQRITGGGAFSKELEELYWKARHAWDHVQGGPMSSDLLISISLQADAIQLPEVVHNPFEDVPPGTAVTWRTETDLLVGTFQRVADPPFAHCVICWVFNDASLERMVRADRVQIDGATPPEQEKKPQAEPKKSAPRAKAPPKSKAKPPEPDRAPSDLTVPDPLADDSPAEGPSKAQRQWGSEKPGTKVMIAVPGEPVAEGVFVRLMPDDTLLIEAGGHKSRIEPDHVLRSVF